MLCSSSEFLTRKMKMVNVLLVLINVMCLLQYYKHVVQSIEKFAQKVSFNNCFLVIFRLHFVVKLSWWGNLLNL